MRNTLKTKGLADRILMQLNPTMSPEDTLTMINNYQASDEYKSAVAGINNFIDKLGAQQANGSSGMEAQLKMEIRKKISDGLKGKVISDEVRKKISESRKRWFASHQ